MFESGNHRYRHGFKHADCGQRERSMCFPCGGERPQDQKCDLDAEVYRDKYLLVYQLRWEENFRTGMHGHLPTLMSTLPCTVSIVDASVDARGEALALLPRAERCMMAAETGCSVRRRL